MGEPTMWTPPDGLGRPLSYESSPTHTHTVLDPHLAVRLDLGRQR